MAAPACTPSAMGRYILQAATLTYSHCESRSCFCRSWHDKSEVLDSMLESGCKQSDQFLASLGEGSIRPEAAVLSAQIIEDSVDVGPSHGAGFLALFEDAVTLQSKRRNC